MTVAIASIQRNRAPWIVEWLAFHMLVGVERFIVYCHRCDDGMPEILQILGRDYPITAYTIGDVDRPQLVAYQHAWDTHQAENHWMAFIDGDEFLFPTRAARLDEALAAFRGQPLSALAVYWICYGSNGHISDPGGLLLEDFPRHSAAAFEPNRHFKSIVRTGQAIQCTGSHLFATPHGTFDEQLRPMTAPRLMDPAQCPSYGHFRINHYVTQHLDYFKQVKQNVGAADRTPHIVRPDAWFHGHDRNECDDGVARTFLPALRRKVAELEAALPEQYVRRVRARGG